MKKRNPTKLDIYITIIASIIIMIPSIASQCLPIIIITAIIVSAFMVSTFREV